MPRALSMVPLENGRFASHITCSAYCSGKNATNRPSSSQVPARSSISIWHFDMASGDVFIAANGALGHRAWLATIPSLRGLGAFLLSSSGAGKSASGEPL